MKKNPEKESIGKQSRAFPIETELNRRKEFSDREVGITHPDLSSFIRLTDQGDIEIFAAPGVGIVISSRSKSISFFGDNVKLFTKEDGLRWNNFNFNYAASNYIEPTLVKINEKTIHSAINGVYHFLGSLSSIDEEERQKPITIIPDYGFSKDLNIPEQKYSSLNSLEDLTAEQAALVEAYSTSYSRNHMELIVKFLKEGYDFQVSHKKALKETNE